MQFASLQNVSKANYGRNNDPKQKTVSADSKHLGHVDDLLLDLIINTSKHLPRSSVKTILGGQAVNRLERVINRLKAYRKLREPDPETIATAVLAVTDDRYLPEFLKLMPEKIPYRQRKK